MAGGCAGWGLGGEWSLAACGSHAVVGGGKCHHQKEAVVAKEERTGSSWAERKARLASRACCRSQGLSQQLHSEVAWVLGEARFEEAGSSCGQAGEEESLSLPSGWESIAWLVELPGERSVAAVEGQGRAVEQAAKEPQVGLSCCSTLDHLAVMSSTDNPLTLRLLKKTGTGEAHTRSHVSLGPF